MIESIEPEMSPKRPMTAWILGLELLLSLVLVVGPFWLFPPCSAATPMRCVWTAKAVSSLAVLLAATTGLALLLADVSITRFAATINIVNALLLALMPLYIIPTCTGPAMSCNTALKPAVILVAIVLMIGSVVALLRGDGAPCTPES